MQDRTLGLLAVGAAVAVLGLNVAFKERPEKKDVEEFSKRLTAQAQWEGRLAPDFELSLLDGSRFALADVVGKKVVVLNFWATWCGPCRQEMPELSRWAKEQASRPVLLVGVDVGERPDTVGAFLKEHPVSYPVALDGSSTVATAYGVSSYPTTTVVGVDGRVALYELGAIANAEVALGEAVKAGLEKLKKGTAITKEAYLAKLKTEPPVGAALAAGRQAAEKLEGRALRIAQAMPCPCGCTDPVDRCGCQTAAAIKKRLKEGSFGGKSDAEVMQELDREFCVKGKEPSHT